MIVTDSTSYLSPELARSLGVVVVPLSVTLGGWSFEEGTVEPAEFYRRLRASGVRPTTSAPSPGRFLEAFEAAAAGGAERVLCITCAATLSATFAAATLAARLTSQPVDVVDSATISGGLLLVVGEVARALRGGTPYVDALALAGSLGGRVASTFVTDSLPLLRAGGRLPRDPAATGGVPVIGLAGGQLLPIGVATSAAASVALQVEVIGSAAAASPTPVTVGHGALPQLADALAAALHGLPGVTRIDRYVVGPAVGAHAGAGNVGASYLRPPDRALPRAAGRQTPADCDSSAR